MQNIYNYTLEELETMLHPSFRAKQIYHWLYVKYAHQFFEMKNLPKTLQKELSETFSADHLSILKIETSQDGSKKYLFKTKDHLSFESVLIKMRDKKTDKEGRILEGEKYTLCLSSQVGCKVGCVFCSTAKGGFVRNLSAGEIVEQVVRLKEDHGLAPEKRVNIVYMGMGEPLDNFENVTKAIQIIAELNGLSISTRRQTISTSGIAPKIKKLGELNLGVQLAISLHAVSDDLRSKLIPMNKAYNIQSVLEAVRAFPVDMRKKIMFEYLVIKDLNDDLESAKALLKLLDGIRAKVNLILFNPHEESQLERPCLDQVKKFADFLISKGLLCTIRESKGIDISAACGQLREKEKRKTQEVSHETQGE